MTNFKVGDRVCAAREANRWIRKNDNGTVTIVEPQSMCVLWDAPNISHVDGLGWWVDPALCDLVHARPSFFARLFGAKAAA